jgi:hypothetical protein
MGTAIAEPVAGAGEGGGCVGGDSDTTTVGGLTGIEVGGTVIDVDMSTPGGMTGSSCSEESARSWSGWSGKACEEDLEIVVGDASTLGI